LFHLPVVGPPVDGSRTASASEGCVSTLRPVALLAPSSTKKRTTSMAPPAIDFARLVEGIGLVAFNSLAPALFGFIVKVKQSRAELGHVGVVACGARVRVHQVGPVRQGPPVAV